MEKAYRTMKNSGAGSIVIGIIILVTCLLYTSPSPRDAQ